MNDYFKTLSVALSLAATSAFAAPELSLDAQVRAEVENDEMTVTLSVDTNGPQVQALTQSAMAVLQRASAKAKRAGGIDVRLGNVHTYPVWGPKGRTANWQVRGDLTLKSTNFAALGLLASELTSEMQISGVHFSLSSTKRAAEQARLTQEVAAAFRSKASTVSQALGYQAYDIKTVQFNQQFGGGGVRPMMAMAKGAAEMADAAVPIPTKGGKSEVSVTMSGTVEMR